MVNLRTTSAAKGGFLRHNRLLRVGLSGALAVTCLIFLFSCPSGEPKDPSATKVVLMTPRDGATIVLLHRFTWRRTDQPSVYHFYLYEVNRTTVWSALVRDTSLILPPAVPLQRGRTYLWRVEAILSDESTVHSDLRTFTLSQ